MAGATPATPEQGELFGLLAEYPGPSELKAAARQVRDAGYSRWDCYSPFPVHGIDPAMGIRPTRLPWIVFLGGLTGLALGLLLQWWANTSHWPWIVSGKPFFSLPANIPIAFETTVLCAAFAAFFGMWALNRLPRPWHPLFASARFARVTSNGFFIAIEAGDEGFDLAATGALLTAAGAIAVEPCHLDPRPSARRVPPRIVAIIIISALVAMVPFALIARARAQKSSKPHWHLIPDMDFQARFRAQNPSPVFADGRASRPQVASTVARGKLRLDDHLNRGLTYREEARQEISARGEVVIAKQRVPMWAREFPAEMPRDSATMQRGRERYDIYCSSCHGLSGYGDGMVQKRSVSVPSAAWVPPSDLHLESIVAQPHGQLYNSITNGVRVGMKGYAPQLTVADRWAIVLYLRALQRSQATAAYGWGNGLNPCVELE